MGVFRFSAALIEWSESELNDVKRLCVQAYKNAWHLPQSTASALFTLPKTHAGKESTLPMAVLTQELLLHAKRCMRHEDVSKKIMLAGLNCTLDEWLCDSFVELIEEMELWKWDDAHLCCVGCAVRPRNGWLARLSSRSMACFKVSMF
jgi:hypothetical protein